VTDLLSLPAEDLAALRPTPALFDRLLGELANSDLTWTTTLAERLDYAYAEILTRATAAGRISALRRLGCHLGRVLAFHRADLTRGDARYFHRWHLLLEMAERRMLWREQLDQVVGHLWFDDVARLLLPRGRSLTDLASGLDLTVARASRVLEDLAGFGDFRHRRLQPEEECGPLEIFPEWGAE
jgi:hypothetical protein